LFLANFAKGTKSARMHPKQRQERKLRMAATRHKKNFAQLHSLSIAVAIVLAALIVLYTEADPKTHLGSFFGNAIADWSGLLVVVIATKYLYETGSAESRKPRHPLVRPFPKFIQNHSLTMFLIITGLGWVLLYRHMDSEAKWGEVVGNIVSEWTQIIGTVLLTKRLMEVRSKESRTR
jgi:hypothetical protein